MHCPYCSIEYSPNEPCFCHPVLNPYLPETDEFGEPASLVYEAATQRGAELCAARLGHQEPVQMKIPAASEVRIAGNEFSSEWNLGLA